MTMPRPVFWSLLVLFSVFLAISLVALNTSFLVSDRFVDSEYSMDDFPRSIKFTADERSQVSEATIGYLMSKAPDSDLLDLTGVSGERIYQASEVSHLSDVRNVLGWLFSAGGAFGTLIVVIIAIGYFRAGSDWKRQLGSLLLWGSVFGMGLYLLMALAAAVDFSFVFIGLHEILFPQGNYFFAAESTLIQLYPEKFWVDAMFLLYAATALETAIVAAIGVILRKSQRSAATGKDVKASS